MPLPARRCGRFARCGRFGSIPTARRPTWERERAESTVCDFRSGRGQRRRWLRTPYTPARRRIVSGPDSAASIAAHYGGQRAGAWWRLACPAHGGDGRNLSIRDDVDDRGNPRLRATCHSAGCDWPDIMAAFRADGLHPPDSPDFQRRNAPESPQSNGTGPMRRGTRRNRPQRDVGAPARSGADSGRPDARAVGLLAATVAIPADPAHPARRWLAARALWRPADDLPPWVRWLPADALAAVHGATPPGPDMVGALTVPAAPLAAWIDAAPDCPHWPRRALTGVHLVNCAADGSPAMDAGGRGKRSYGRMAGAVTVVGLIDPAHGATLAEGAADALALAARFRPAAVATLGKPRPDVIAPALRTAGRVRIAPDFDIDKRTGQQEGVAWARRIAALVDGADLTGVHAGYKDAAAWAAATGFPDVDADVLAGWRVVLASAGLPAWEADRAAYAVALDCVGGPSLD